MSYSIDLHKRIALVTGASSGLGAQFACTLSRAGATEVLASPTSHLIDGAVISADDGFSV